MCSNRNGDNVHSQNNRLREKNHGWTDPSNDPSTTSQTSIIFSHTKHEVKLILNESVRVVDHYTNFHMALMSHLFLPKIGRWLTNPEMRGRVSGTKCCLDKTKRWPVIVPMTRNAIVFSRTDITNPYYASIATITTDQLPQYVSM